MSASPPPFLSPKDSGQTFAESEKNGYDPALEKKTMYGNLLPFSFKADKFSPVSRYVDWRIIPVLSTVYAVALIDRLNLGMAYTAGMGVDLVSTLFS
jgi:hypothetical protein